MDNFPCRGPNSFDIGLPMLHLGEKKETCQLVCAMPMDKIACLPQSSSFDILTIASLALGGFPVGHNLSLEAETCFPVSHCFVISCVRHIDHDIPWIHWFKMTFLCVSFTLPAMFSKNPIIAERHDLERPDKRLRRNLADLYLGGQISAGRAATLFQDATQDGAQHVSDLAVSSGKNAQRDLSRKLLKDSKWPPLYETQVPQLDKSTQQLVQGKINLLLPHEVIYNILQWNQAALPNVFDLEGLSTPARSHFDKACGWVGVPPHSTLPIGLWADGCPVKWDRSQSIIVVTMNFCGQKDDRFQRLRIPLCVTSLQLA